MGDWIHSSRFHHGVLRMVGWRCLVSGKFISVLQNITNTEICQKVLTVFPHNRSCACQIGLSLIDTQCNGSSPFPIDGKARELVCGEEVYYQGLIHSESTGGHDKPGWLHLSLRGNAPYQQEVTL
jgi:hypothetical protein